MPIAIKLYPMDFLLQCACVVQTMINCIRLITSTWQARGRTSLYACSTNHFSGVPVLNCHEKHELLLYSVTRQSILNCLVGKPEGDHVFQNGGWNTTVKDTSALMCLAIKPFAVWRKKGRYDSFF